MYKYQLVIFLCFPLIGLFVVDTFSLTKQINGICTKVIDGDTIIVNSKKIRLFGIDAPEIDQFSIDKKPIGLWSYQYLKNKIEGKRVKVSYQKKGYYNRIIGTVFYEENINLNLIKNGMAIRYKFNPKREYKNAEYVARINRLGIFATKGFKVPYYFRKQKKSRFKKRPSI